MYQLTKSQWVRDFNKRIKPFIYTLESEGVTLPELFDFIESYGAKPPRARTYEGCITKLKNNYGRYDHVQVLQYISYYLDLQSPEKLRSIYQDLYGVNWDPYICISSTEKEQYRKLGTFKCQLPTKRAHTFYKQLNNFTFLKRIMDHIGEEPGPYISPQADDIYNGIYWENKGYRIINVKSASSTWYHKVIILALDREEHNAFLCWLIKRIGALDHLLFSMADMQSISDQRKVALADDTFNATFTGTFPLDNNQERHENEDVTNTGSCICLNHSVLKEAFAHTAEIKELRCDYIKIEDITAYLNFQTTGILPCYYDIEEVKILLTATIINAANNSRY